MTWNAAGFLVTGRIASFAACAILVLCAGCTDGRFHTAAVVNYESHSALAQQYQVALEQRLLQGASADGEGRVVHLISAEAGVHPGPLGNSSVLYAVTAQDGSVVWADRCSANVAECSSRIAEVAELSCEVAGCHAAPAAGARVINRKPANKRAVGLSTEIERAFSKGEAKLGPEVECAVHIIDAVDRTANPTSPFPYRAYFVVTGSHGGFVGGEDCAPNDAIGECGRWIARRAAQMCMDSMSDRTSHDLIGDAEDVVGLASYLDGLLSPLL